MGLTTTRYRVPIIVAKVSLQSSFPSSGQWRRRWLQVPQCVHPRKFIPEKSSTAVLNPARLHPSSIRAEIRDVVPFLWGEAERRRTLSRMPVKPQRKTRKRTSAGGRAASHRGKENASRRLTPMTQYTLNIRGFSSAGKAEPLFYYLPPTGTVQGKGLAEERSPPPQKRPLYNYKKFLTL